MTIQNWLGEMPKTEFVEQHYQKLPFCRNGGGRQYCHLGTWSSVGRILAQPGADVMAVRQGEQWSGEPPGSMEEAEALSRQGYTILIRHAERHDADLAELAAGFQADLGGEVNIHIYATPGGQFGFGWHYDAEEVFILQTVGRKEYSLRKNTVHPWPLVETLVADMKYPREIMPLMRCLLAPGDWLYIPAGYWHRGQAEETAISLAIGVMAPAAIDVYDLLRRKLLEDLRWRQRLPTVGDASPAGGEQLRQQYRQLLDQLAGDLQHRLGDDRFLDELLEHLAQRGGP